MPAHDLPFRSEIRVCRYQRVRQGLRRRQPSLCPLLRTHETSTKVQISLVRGPWWRTDQVMLGQYGSVMKLFRLLVGPSRICTAGQSLESSREGSRIPQRVQCPNNSHPKLPLFLKAALYPKSVISRYWVRSGVYHSACCSDSDHVDQWE